jgi:hypothetical protein
MDEKRRVFVDNSGKMFLTTIGELLDNVKRVWKSCWEMHQPLGNSWRLLESRWEMPPRKLIPAIHMLLLARCDGNQWNEAFSQ